MPAIACGSTGGSKVGSDLCCRGLRLSKTQVGSSLDRRGYSWGLRAKGVSGMGKWLSTVRLVFFVKTTVSRSVSDTEAYTLLKFEDSV